GGGRGLPGAVPPGPVRRAAPRGPVRRGLHVRLLPLPAGGAGRSASGRGETRLARALDTANTRMMVSHGDGFPVAADRGLVGVAGRADRRAQPAAADDRGT